MQSTSSERSNGSWIQGADDGNSPRRVGDDNDWSMQFTDMISMNVEGPGAEGTEEYSREGEPIAPLGSQVSRLHPLLVAPRKLERNTSEKGRFTLCWFLAMGAPTFVFVLILCLGHEDKKSAEKNHKTEQGRSREIDPCAMEFTEHQLRGIRPLSRMEIEAFSEGLNEWDTDPAGLNEWATDRQMWYNFRCSVVLENHREAFPSTKLNFYIERYVEPLDETLRCYALLKLLDLYRPAFASYEELGRKVLANDRRVGEALANERFKDEVQHLIFDMCLPQVAYDRMVKLEKAVDPAPDATKPSRDDESDRSSI